MAARPLIQTLVCHNAPAQPSDATPAKITILTINDHFPLHEVLVNKTADFASIYSTQLSRWSPNLQCSVLSKPKVDGTET
jgi:hypothetical protein